jgi:hypothetical protein
MMRKARHVVELWQSMGRGKIPRRDDFKIANFPMLAPHLMVASVANQLSEYQVTHAGSAVEQSYGWGLNGLSFARIDLGAVKDEVLEDYEFCATKRVVIRLVSPQPDAAARGQRRHHGMAARRTRADRGFALERRDARLGQCDVNLERPFGAGSFSYRRSKAPDMRS